MMQSFLSVVSHPGVPQSPVQYNADSFYDDLSRQLMASSANRRHSRGANGALAGNAMRVSKPSSANNSPRTYIMQQRRKTMMSDPLYARRTQPALEQPYLPTPVPDMYERNYYEPVKSAPRPVSWHPSSYQSQPQQQLPAISTPAAQYPFPAYNDVDLYTSVPQLPPTPVAFSAYGSPVSAFSPLSLPFSEFEPVQAQYYSPVWAASAVPANTPVATTTLSSMNPTQTTVTSFALISTPCNITEPARSPVDWNTFVAHGFNNVVTAPPTPEDMPRAQQPQPVLPCEESIPYHPLEEDEEEGEILIGMGLYDTPEKDLADPELDNYRQTASLLGSSLEYPERTGKGLKLEDAWEPPASDDEDDDDDDAEGESSSCDEE